jgi:hypothetical protein
VEVRSKAWALGEVVPPGVWEIIRWWELRSVLYNLAVGVVGLTSVAVMQAVGSKLVQPGGRLCRAFDAHRGVPGLRSSREPLLYIGMGCRTGAKQGRSREGARVPRLGVPRRNVILVCAFVATHLGRVGGLGDAPHVKPVKSVP